MDFCWSSSQSADVSSAPLCLPGHHPTDRCVAVASLFPLFSWPSSQRPLLSRRLSAFLAIVPANRLTPIALLPAGPGPVGGPQQAAGGGGLAPGAAGKRLAPGSAPGFPLCNTAADSHTTPVLPNNRSLPEAACTRSLIAAHLAEPGYQRGLPARPSRALLTQSPASRTAEGHPPDRARRAPYCGDGRAVCGAGHGARRRRAARPGWRPVQVRRAGLCAVQCRAGLRLPGMAPLLPTACTPVHTHHAHPPSQLLFLTRMLARRMHAAPCYAPRCGGSPAQSLCASSCAPLLAPAAGTTPTSRCGSPTPRRWRTRSLRPPTCCWCPRCSSPAGSHRCARIACCGGGVAGRQLSSMLSPFCNELFCRRHVVQRQAVASV